MVYVTLSGNSNGIAFLQVADIECSDHFIALIVVVEDDILRANDAVVEAYLHSA